MHQASFDVVGRVVPATETYFPVEPAVGNFLLLADNASLFLLVDNMSNLILASSI